MAIERMADHVAYFDAYLEAGKPHPVAEELFWRIEQDAAMVRSQLKLRNFGESGRAKLEEQYQALQHIVREVFARDLAPLPAADDTSQTAATRDTSNTRQGQIKGTIRDLNGEPIQGAVVHLYNQWGNFVKSYTTGSNGLYHLSDLSAVPFFLVVTATGYVDEGYPDIPCHNGLEAGCEDTDLQAIEVNINESITGVDFELDFAPTIAGTAATTTGSYTVVRLYDEQLNLLDSESVEDDGSFIFEVDSYSTYKLLAFSFISHSALMYDDVVCYGLCDLSEASDIVVTNQNVVLNHMLIPPSQRMTGVLIDQGTGLPTNAITYLEFFDADSGVLRTYFPGRHIGEDGTWIQFLQPGDYHVRVLSNDYQVHYALDQNCAGSDVEHCDFNTVTPTTIAHDNINGTSDIQLNLVRAGSISGQLIYPLNNRDLRNEDVVLYDATGAVVDSVDTEAGGLYSFTGLPDGTYFVATSQRFQPTAYPDYRCALNRNNDYTCLDITQSTPVVVSQQAQVTGIDITIQNQPDIRGTILDDNSEPVNNIWVRLYEEFNGELVFKASTITNATGIYQFLGLHNGNFYVSAERFGGQEYNFPFYQSWYPNAVCDEGDLSCPLNQALPVVIADHNDADDRDIQLTRRGRLDITLSAPLSHAPKGVIKLFDTVGQLVNSYSVNGYREIYVNDGQFHMVFTDNDQEYDPLAKYISHVKGSGDCFADCEPSLGTVFNIQPQSINPIDFTINKAHHVGVGLGSEFNRSELLFYVNDSLLTSVQYYQSNSFYLNTNQAVKLGVLSEGFKPAFHSNVTCDDLSCALAAANPILPTPAGNTTAQLNMMPHNSVTGRVYTADGTDVSMRVKLIPVDPSGKTYDTSITTSGGTFLFEALEEGDYYVYAYETSFTQDPGYSSTLYGAGACAEEALCDYSSAGIVQVRDGQFIENIDIEVFPLGNLRIQNPRYSNGLISHHAQFWLFEWHDGQYRYVKEDNMLTGQTELDLERLYQQNYRLMGVQKLNSYYIKTVYPNVSCAGLDQQTCLSMGADIPISWGQETLINDMILSTPPALEVHVTDADNGEYVASYSVRLYNPENEYLLFSYPIYSSESGQFLPVSPESSYVMEIRTSENGPYDSQLYDGVNCPLGVGTDCELIDGTIFSVTENELLNLSVALQKRPAFNISVVDEVTRSPIPSSVKLYDLNEQLFNEYDSQTGIFNINLRAGSYYVVAGAASHNAKAHHDKSCSSHNLYACNDGYAEVIVDQNNEPSIQLALNLRRGIQGFVIEEETGLPLPGINMDAWTRDGEWQSVTTTAANGGFWIYSDETLIRISTDVPRPSYLYDEVYDDVECYEGSAFDGFCSPTSGRYRRTYLPATVLIELGTDLIHVNGFDVDQTGNEFIELD